MRGWRGALFLFFLCLFVFQLTFLFLLSFRYLPAHQLALDMLNRTRAHADIVEVLLARGLPGEALRFARVHNCAVPPPSRFLAAAAAIDRMTFFAVYKALEAEALRASQGGVKGPLFGRDQAAEQYVDLFNQWFVREAEPEDELY